MKILFINPPAKNEISANIPSVVEKERGYTPPLGLLYVAAYVKANTDYEVRLIDALLENIGQEQIKCLMASFMPDVVGITALSMTMVDVMQTVQTAKTEHPGAKVVLGGPHPHLFPEETINLPGVDYIVTGEGEIAFCDLVRSLDAGREPVDVKGLVYRLGGRTVYTGESLMHDDLDRFPFPARQLVNYKKYHSSIAARTPITTMMTSRGCPFSCSFCDRPHLGKKFRARSAGNVAEEMEHCQELGINEILFYDDTFTIDRRRVLEICDRIHRRKIRVHWDIRSRVDTVDEEMIRALSRANCKRIHFGVEAGTERIINGLNKGITLEQVHKAFNTARRHGISTLAYFMIGNPGETARDIKETINLALKLKPDYALFSILVPYPGTRVYLEGLKEGIIAGDYWRDFARSPVAGFVPGYWPGELSRGYLEGFIVEAYKKFYSRPEYILKQLLKTKSPGELFRKARTGWKVLKIKGK